MDSQLEVAYISTAAALLGSVIGGLVSYLTTRYLKREEWRQERIDKQISLREELYANFIEECSRLALSSIDKKSSEVKVFAKMGSLWGRIKLVASPAVIQAACELQDQVIDMHAKDPNPKYAKKMGYQNFSDIARKELDELRKTT